MFPHNASGWEISFFLLALVAFCGKSWILWQAIQDRAVVRTTLAKQLAMRCNRKDDVSIEQDRLDEEEAAVGLANLCLADGNVEAEIIRLTIPGWFLFAGIAAFYLPAAIPDQLSPKLTALRALVRLSFFFPIIMTAYGSWRSYRRRKLVNSFDEMNKPS